MPEEVRAKAKAYEVKRHLVLALHYAMRSLFAGRPKEFLGVARALGPSAFMQSFFFWLITVNNRLYRPRGLFVAPKPNEIALGARHQQLSDGERS